jgi:hypothetical protein
MGLSSWWANQEDPRYAAANRAVAPTVSEADLEQQSPARTGCIDGSLFRSPTNYTRFAGGLDQLWMDGREVAPLGSPIKPYSYAGVSPTRAWRDGGFDWHPKLSAFVNKALNAANAGRNQAIPFLRGPMAPLPVEETFAVPINAVWDQFPAPTMPFFNRQPGYVTQWPAVQMQYRNMGGGA